MQGTRKLTPAVPVPEDLDIAMSIEPKPITEIAAALGLLPSELKPYGDSKAKVKLSVLDRLKDAPLGKYVVVAGINPTPLGEGKSTTTIGLAQMLAAHAGKTAIACIRQPSQGPTFGVKGGAAGGGYSQVIPMDEFNLHGTGDIHAIGAANNLLAAAIDTRVMHERNQDDEKLFKLLTDNYKSFAPTMLKRLKKLGIAKTAPKDLTPEERSRFARLSIDPKTISWRRVVDVNDRFLRTITVGQGKAEEPTAESPEFANKTANHRQTGFDITVASELMAILALSADLEDMRNRIGDIQVALSTTGEPVTAEDIGCAGAMLVLMKDTIEPTLMQTLEATPVLVHAGPFGNIAHGNSSIISDEIGLRLVGPDGYILTEAGFGADMGCEKFFNIKCRTSGRKPDAAVIVATVRALKFHGGVAPAAAAAENLDAVRAGAANLLRHIDNTHKFGVPSIVVLNRFTSDTAAEIALVRELCAGRGVVDVVLGEHWAKGGAGLLDAATALAKCPPAKFQCLYPDAMPLEEKIRCIAQKIYGADDISMSDAVRAKLAAMEKLGYGKFPVCMAKTQYSFSHDANLKGAPTGFTVPVRDVFVSAGARFVFPLLGDISTMPGLPTRPNYYSIDIDFATGKIVGLS